MLEIKCIGIEKTLHEKIERYRVQNTMKTHVTTSYSKAVNMLLGIAFETIEKNNHIEVKQ